MTVCAHCTHPALGLAGRVVGGELETLTSPKYQHLCHPDFGLDCYSLVTVAGHDTPCLNCKPIRVEQDALRKVGKFGLMT